MSDSPASRMLQSVQNSAQPTTQQWLQPASDSPPPATSQQTSAPQSTTVTDQQKLDTFESVLSEIEAEKQVSAPVDAAENSPTQPQVSQPISQPSQPPPTAGYSSAISKEQVPGSVVSPELPGGMQYVETERSPEIPPEVESYLQKVEEQAEQLPQEIVIAAQEHAANQPRNLPQDVKVLPITADQAEAAKKKNTSFSIRWLAAFSEKLAEMFKGKAVYRNE